jgi:hypothetical protein
MLVSRWWLRLVVFALSSGAFFGLGFLCWYASSKSMKGWFNFKFKEANDLFAFLGVIAAILGMIFTFAATHALYRSRSVVTIPRCPKCRYSLIGLTENRCPECGESFPKEWLVDLKESR